MREVFEELKDLRFGVGIVEPDSANVGWVGGVVSYFGGVEVVPAAMEG